MRKSLIERISPLLISIKYVIISVLSYRYLATGGGVWMEVATSFFISVVSGIVAYYICKWLDGDNKDSK